MKEHKLEILCIHCAATPEGKDVKAKSIADYHTRPVEEGGRGWDRKGYSDIVELSGKLVRIAEYNEDDIVQRHEVTWGATGINHKARHVCYVGGMDSENRNPKNTMTPEQELTLIRIVFEMIAKYPNIKIAGHNQFAKKACPSFDVPNWCRMIGVPEKNIYAN